MTLLLVAPPAMIRSTMSRCVKRSMTVSGSDEETSISISPTVSRIRRRLPAKEASSTTSSSERVETICDAMG